MDQVLQQDEPMEDVDAAEEEAAAEEAAPAVPSCISTMIDSGSVESRRYFLARRTVLEMLRDRGFAVPEAEIDRPLADFRAWWNPNPELGRLTVSYTLASDCSKKIQVMFLGPEPVKIGVIRDIHNRVHNEGLSRLILILQSKISSRARDAIKPVFSFKVETFHLSELLVNITKHVLKPKHIVLNPEEKREFLSKYNVEVSQLPHMLEKDGISRYYGLEKGSVLKVEYEGDLTGSHEAYRASLVELAVLLSQSRTTLNVTEKRGIQPERTNRRDVNLSEPNVRGFSSAYHEQRRCLIGGSQSMGQRIKRLDFVPWDPSQVGFESRVMGNYHRLPRLWIHHRILRERERFC